MLNIVTIFIGGGLGAASRYLLSRFVSEHAFTAVPLGTLIENITGALLIGFFFRFFESAAVPGYLRSMVTVGFIGGFTTFSTYALETFLLFERRQYTAAGLNFLIHNTAGFAAVFAGMLLADLASAGLKGGFHAQ